MNLRNLLNKASVKITILITLLVMVLFIALNFVLIKRGETAFNDVYYLFSHQSGPFPDRAPFFGPSVRYYIPIKMPDTGEELTPAEHFRARFQLSLLLIGLAGFFGAAGIGLLTSRAITKPVNKLSSGMKKLRGSNYALKLEENESEEFNKIIKEFNSLATELHRVEELRKNLISDTSHELKTPLTSILAQLEGIEDGVLAADPKRIKLLKEQALRLHELTEGLQDYARLRGQFVQPKQSNFRFKDLLEKLITERQSELTVNSLTVKLEFPEDYSLTADRSLIERVFTNLLNNAIRYSHAGQITIAAENNQIVFGDDGVGIPPRHLRDIFERFFRLEKSRNRKTGGMGLGLAIVNEIIAAHGWNIYARIPKNGKGVEFVIDLN